MKIAKQWEKDGFQMRLATQADKQAYYQQNFNPLDSQIVRLTGCKAAFTQEEVFAFFQNAIESEDYYLFLLIAPDGRIAGESILNEIDFTLRCANFRIGIFDSSERGKGIGTWMVETTRDFAFEELKLHRLELDVYSFNPRAERVYQKAGFRREGVLRDAVLDGQQYADDILMSILEEEWRQLKGLV